MMCESSHDVFKPLQRWLFLSERKRKMLKIMDIVVRAYCFIAIGYVCYKAFQNRGELKEIVKVIRETEGTSLFVEEK